MEERVLCLTTIDKDVTDLVRDDFIKKQSHTSNPSAHLYGLQKLQSLVFSKMPSNRNNHAWSFSVKEEGKEKGGQSGDAKK